MDFSGLFTAISVLGVGWITGYFALRQKQEEEKARTRADYEKYRGERLEENDRLRLNPLRQEMMLLEDFMEAVDQTYLIDEQDGLFSEEEQKATQLSLARTSIKIYRYKDLKAKLSIFTRSISDADREDL
jgi:hypothetical protein